MEFRSTLVGLNAGLAAGQPWRRRRAPTTTLPFRRTGIMQFGYLNFPEDRHRVAEYAPQGIRYFTKSMEREHRMAEAGSHGAKPASRTTRW